MLSRVQRKIHRVIFDTIYPRMFPTRFKEAHEIAYWRSRKAEEATLTNDHYAPFYTDHFGLSPDFYAGKRILDIGCGPRGSLEWADMASERVGMDPLAKEYLRMGASAHKMKYVASGSESIPFPDGHFDVVCSFNSLDHVANLERTIAEIARVVKPGGLFLLLTDVDHDPTPTEPISYSWDIVQSFTNSFDILEERHYEKPIDSIYDSIIANQAYNHEDRSKRYGILSAKFQRRDGKHGG